MSGELCALWFGLVSLAAVCLMRRSRSLAAFFAVGGAIPSCFFLRDQSPLIFERSAASRHGAHAALFQIAIRWDCPPFRIMAGGVRAPRIRLINSRSSNQPDLGVRGGVERV
jgi:hypothetical protein